MQGEHASVVLFWSTGRFVGDFKFEDGRWVNNTSIALSEAACSCCYGLLPYFESVIQWR
jgi:hypothetical protein